jgi:hypothetical protein
MPVRPSKSGERQDKVVPHFPQKTRSCQVSTPVPGALPCGRENALPPMQDEARNTPPGIG